MLVAILVLILLAILAVFFPNFLLIAFTVLVTLGLYFLWGWWAVFGILSVSATLWLLHQGDQRIRQARKSQ